jgi:RNA polymerase sigma-70 factor, ECF subfamily
MQNPAEIGIFQRQRAEVPHTAGAITLTDSSIDWPIAADAGQPEEADELVERAKAGDAEALQNLLAAARPRAVAAALKVVHNRDDAEDAVQDAFLKVWRCLDAFEGRSSFSTWIHRIVTNASLDLLRRNTSRGEVADRAAPRDGEREGMPIEIEQAIAETPETTLCQREIQSLVRAAVAALPSAHRQAVELREFEDFSYQEMADIIRCPVGTVMSRLHHARNKLASGLAAPLGERFERYAA